MEQTASVLPFPQAPDGIELRHLRAFVAVAEELNFGRAAERLYVSQPALSRQIRGLEQLVGCELLRRSTHSVELTLAGEALLDRSRRLLRDVDEAVAAALSVGGELIGRVARALEPLRGMLAGDRDLVETRATFESLMAQFSPPAGTITRPVTAGGVPSLVVSPGADHGPAVLYLHGGGYVIGSAFGYQPHAGALAAAAQTGILVPDYRLAPEHPFPAALEDALRAYLWLRDQAADPDAIIVAGDSAGGGLALSLLLALKRDGLALPAASVILCPWLDLTLRTASASDAPLATDDDVRRCVEAYLSGHPADDPIVDALHADLSGLPPMLIQAATGDARLVDAKALAATAQDHAVDARLELFPVQAHAFQLFWSFLPEAADAIESAGAFIREFAVESRTARAAGDR
ncbi:MAG TPA: alpha/beta hydrolase fold domain-containing protein [Solirubrobacteraceae bacterium]|nr:alpha/beta hydrolase fold domain-containing protein [Solirubrobacteraceae bacterium]